MSQIGRVFSVLNVMLAAVFLWSAGTFLQKHTYTKEELSNQISELEQQLESTEQQLVAKDQELGDKSRQLQATIAQLQSAETQVEDLKSDNKRLGDRLSAMERDIKNMSSSLATVSSSVDAASALAAASQEKALEAAGERDEAVRAKELALADKRDAEVLVDDLRTTIGNLESNLAAANLEIERQGNILQVVRDKYPGLLVNVTPKFSGRVVNVGPQNRLVTLQITDAASLAEPGASVAVWDNTGYKGEVLLTEVYDEGQAVGRVRLRKDGAPQIRVGDSFSSQIDG